MAADTTTEYNSASSITNDDHVNGMGCQNFWGPFLFRKFIPSPEECNHNAILGKSEGSRAYKIQARFNSPSNVSDSMYHLTILQSLRWLATDWMTWVQFMAHPWDNWSFSKRQRLKWEADYSPPSCAECMEFYRSATMRIHCLDRGTILPNLYYLPINNMNSPSLICRDDELKQQA
jgi:hypothetical protein